MSVMVRSRAQRRNNLHLCCKPEATSRYPSYLNLNHSNKAVIYPHGPHRQSIRNNNNNAFLVRPVHFFQSATTTAASRPNYFAHSIRLPCNHSRVEFFITAKLLNHSLEPSMRPIENCVSRLCRDPRPMIRPSGVACWNVRLRSKQHREVRSEHLLFFILSSRDRLLFRLPTELFNFNVVFAAWNMEQELHPI